jgi:hypothetical protein
MCGLYLYCIIEDKVLSTNYTTEVVNNIFEHFEHFKRNVLLSISKSDDEMGRLPASTGTSF